MADISREKLVVQIFCSVHPDHELTYTTHLEMPYARSRIVVHPCSKCKAEHTKPTKIERAIMRLREVKD